jgi:hypothetical protein
MRPLLQSAFVLSLLPLIFGQTDKVEWGVQAPVLVIPAVFRIDVNNQINEDGFQLSEAFKCAIDQLNAANVIPGLQITTDIRDLGKSDATLLAKEFVGQDRMYPFIFAAAGKESMLSLFKEVKDSNASLISYTSMSSVVRPAMDTAAGMAAAGPMPMMAGSTPTAANDLWAQAAPARTGSCELCGG